MDLNIWLKGVLCQSHVLIARSSKIDLYTKVSDQNAKFFKFSNETITKRPRHEDLKADKYPISHQSSILSILPKSKPDLIILRDCQSHFKVQNGAILWKAHHPCRNVCHDHGGCNVTIKFGIWIIKTNGKKKEDPKPLLLFFRGRFSRSLISRPFSGRARSLGSGSGSSGSFIQFQDRLSCPRLRDLFRILYCSCHWTNPTWV